MEASHGNSQPSCDLFHTHQLFCFSNRLKRVSYAGTGRLWRTAEESPRKAGGVLANRSALQSLSSDPLLRFKGDIHECLKVIETERGAVTPGTRLILERAGKARCEERALLADALPDRRFDVPTSQRHCWSVGRHGVSSSC